MKTNINIVNDIEQAVIKFYEVYDIICAMQDNDYISLSNFTKILNIIFDTDRITPNKLNKVLAKAGVIKKMEKQLYDLMQQKGLKPSRYVLNNHKLMIYALKKDGTDYSFYMFKPIIYLVALHINVVHEKVTDEMALNLIKCMRREKYSDVNIVKINLQAFQSLLTAEKYADINNVSFNYSFLQTLLNNI